MENMNTTLEDDNMERTCNSCQKQNQCPKFNNFTEEERSELSCNKYEPMAFETYLGVQQEKTRRFMMPLSGIERFFT